MGPKGLPLAAGDFKWTVPVTIHAENNGQFHYLSRHSCSDCYEEGIRSVRVALKNWQ